MKIRYLIIGNPKSGKGRLSSILPSLEQTLKKNDLNYEIRRTEYKNHARKLALEAVEDGFSHIVSVGGDGTFSEIVNSIYDKDIIWGLIPLGSGNDFSKSVGISQDPNTALDAIIKGNIMQCDIAKLGDRLFINGFGIGLDGGVAQIFKYFRFLGPYVGYKLGAVIQAFLFKGFNVEAKGDNFEYEGKTLLCGASNGSTQGGISLAPEAKVNDGLLDFHFISDMNPIKRLITLTKAINAEHTDMKEVKLVKLEKMKISLDNDLPAHMDGESFILEKGKYEIDILRNAIKVMVP